jgi:hypothetical protein
MNCLTTVLTTTLTTVSHSTTPTTAPKRTHRAWSRLLPAPGSLGARVAVVASAVSRWLGYRRAGGHRLFTASDREPTGIARFLSRFEIVNPVVAQSETGTNGDCRDLRIANPLVAGAVQRVSRDHRRRISGSASSRVLSGAVRALTRQSHIAVRCSPAVAGLTEPDPGSQGR